MSRAPFVSPPDYLHVKDANGDMRVIDNQQACCIAWLRWSGVSEAIIDRVVRLNDSFAQGLPLRGIHYKRSRWSAFSYVAATKGQIIRRFGRAAFEGIPRKAWLRDGKRILVTHRDIARYLGGFL
jgi:hypothetical protein